MRARRRHHSPGAPVARTTNWSRGLRQPSESPRSFAPLLFHLRIWRDSPRRYSSHLQLHTGPLAELVRGGSRSAAVLPLAKLACGGSRPTGMASPRAGRHRQGSPLLRPLLLLWPRRRRCPRGEGAGERRAKEGEVEEERRAY
jgi:hypothetical protein